MSQKINEVKKHFAEIRRGIEYITDLPPEIYVCVDPAMREVDAAEASVVQILRDYERSEGKKLNSDEILALDIQDPRVYETRIVTIKDYFHILLRTLWEEEEGFSGKRPFGNSGWKWDVYVVLIRAGVIDGELDEDGLVKAMSDIEMEKAEKLISRLIEHIFAAKTEEK